MLLDNFYIVMKRNGFSNTTYSNNSIQAIDGTILAYNLWGVTSPFTSLTNDNLETFSSGSGKLLLGSGSTTPIASDYKLESIVPNASILQTSTIINTASITSNLCGFSKTVTNISGSPILFSEIGYAVGLGTSSRGALITRTLLPTPITLQPNDMYTFTEYIKFNL